VATVENLRADLRAEEVDRCASPLDKVDVDTARNEDALLKK
jgi:hypothetical protein